LYANEGAGYGGCLAWVGASGGIPLVFLPLTEIYQVFDEGFGREIAFGG